MNWPTVVYKPGHFAKLFELDGDLVFTLTATVQDVHEPGKTAENNFRWTTSVRGMDDSRVLSHWLVGCIAQYERHESAHWLTIDGESLRDESD